MFANLRHLRILAAIAALGSVSGAARQMNLSQPAVTQALARMEALAGASLFDRSPRGLYLTQAGQILTARVDRALALLDPALRALGARMVLTTTLPQIQALIAVTETESFSEAARQLGLAQPSVYRAIQQMEQELGRPLFERTARRITAYAPTQALAIAARLAQAELDQATAELAELAGQEVGRIALGAMPLSRACLLGPALARFRAHRPTLPIRVIGGSWAELVPSLRRGDLDLMVGALRPADQEPDLMQEPLFTDEMVIVARAGHPLAQADTLAALQGASWVVSGQGAPARHYFSAMFAPAPEPESLIETDSSVLMRQILVASDHLGFVSAMQVEHDIAQGALVPLPLRPIGTRRPIGMIWRAGWQPTPAQRALLDDLRHCAATLPQAKPAAPL
jgi:LysR family transcriptional regulator, regulator for genes of the gallate degradation pathway